MKYDWEEIYKKLKEGSTYKEIINEYGMAYATLVRRWKAYNAGELATREINFDQETLDAITKKELRVLTDQKKNTMIRQEANKASRNLSVVETIKESIESMDIKPFKSQRINRKEIDSKKTTQKFIMSDLHYVDEKRSSSLNKMSRMWVENWDGSESVYLIFNGDLIENTHHVSQLLDKDSSNPAYQSVEVAQIIAQQIKEFSDNINENIKINIVWTNGNHDEIRQLTKAGDTPRSNWVEIISNMVSALLKDYENIENDDSVYQEYIGLDGMHIQHGHLLKSNRQESVEQFLIKKSVREGRLYNLYVISHFHQFRHWVMKGSKDDTQVVLTPSMKDWDGEFENTMNMSNTSGLISIDNDNNVKFIKIPGNELMNKGE